MTAAPRKVAVTWLDLAAVVLLALTGMGIWHLCAARVDDELRDLAPARDEIAERLRLPELRRALAAGEEEWKATLAQAVQQRFEAAKQDAILEALAASPAATSPGASASPTAVARPAAPTATDADLAKRRREAAAARDTAARTAAALDRRQRALEADLGRQQHDLRLLEATARRRLHEERARFDSRLRDIRLAAATLGAALALAVAGLLILALRRWLAGALHGGPVLIVSALAIGVLYWFAAFGAAGLALAAAPILLVAIFLTVLRGSSAADS